MLMAHMLLKMEKSDNILDTIKTFIKFHVLFWGITVIQYAKIHKLVEGYDCCTQRLYIFS